MYVLQGSARQQEAPEPPVKPPTPPLSDPPSSVRHLRGPPVDGPASSQYRTALHYDLPPGSSTDGPGVHPVILTSKDFNEEAFDQRQRERLAEIAADQERAMYASKEVEKRQRVVATELIQLEQQRRQVQSELRGLQKQQRMVEDEFGEIERQQRAIEAKLLEMQLRQKQVEYETQLKELIYEANTPVGMSYVRQLPARQRSVPRHVGRSATPDTSRSYDSAPYVLDRPHSAQMERRYLPGGSLQRGEGVPPSGRPRLKRSSSLKKLFSSLGRKDKHKDQYGDPSEAPPKKSGVLRNLKKKVDNATYSFYEAQKPYETVKFKKNKDAGATAYSESPQPGTPTGLPPSSRKKSLHGKDANKQQPGGINIVRSNQQVNAAIGRPSTEETPLKIRETKSYMVEESTDYLRKTYLPREEFSITTSKTDFTQSDAPRPESLISVKEDTITPRLNKQPSREDAVRDAMGTLEKKEKEGKKTLKEEAEATVESQTPASPIKDAGVKVIVTEPEVDLAVKKDMAAKEAKLMKMAAGAETSKQQSMDKMESLEKMTNDNGHVEEKYKSLEATTKETVTTAEPTARTAARPVNDAEKDDVGKWKVKRMDKVDIDMPSSQKEQGHSDLEKKKVEGQSEKEAEKSKESKIVAAVDQGITKVDNVTSQPASGANTQVQSARFRPVVVKKTEAPAPPGGEAQQQQPASTQQPVTTQQQPAATQPAGKTMSQPAAATKFGTTPASAETTQLNQRQQPLLAANQQQQPAIPSIQQVRVTNYDNIDFSHYYRSLTSPETTSTATATGSGSADHSAIRDVVGVERAQTTCSNAYCDSTSDSGVSTLERPPSLKHPTPTGGVGGASMRTKPPISTAGARLIIESNRNNVVDVNSEGHLKPRSRSADTVPKIKQSQISKRSKSAEGPSTMRNGEETLQYASENVSENNLPHPPPNTPRNTPESTPNETPKTTPRHTPKMLRRYFQPIKSGSPKGSPKTTPKSADKGILTGTPEDTPGGSPSSTPKSARHGTPKALKRILQPVVENMVHAVKTSWDRHRPRSRSGSRSRGGSGSSGSGSRDKSPDPFIETTVTPTCDVTTTITTTTSYVTSYVTTVSAVGSDVIIRSPTTGNEVTGSNKSGSTITIDDTVVFLRRDISRRRSEAQKREKRSSRSMDRAGQETEVPEEMQVQPIRRSLSVDISELDNLELPYVSMTYMEDKKRRAQEETPLNYNTEYDALIKRMNTLAEVAERDLSVQARTQPQRIMYYDTPYTP